MAKNKVEEIDLDSLGSDQICFVISPIGESGSDSRKRSDQILNHIIKPAVEQAGLTAVRSDHLPSSGIITSQIIRHIINDRIIVADLTDQNPNVFYELALRHAFRKPVVQLILADQKIPFDVQGVRTVQYSLTLDGVAQAREQVTKQINSALAKGYEVESPVTVAAQLQELTRSTTPEIQLLIKTIADQIESLNKSVADVNKSVADVSRAIYRHDSLKEALPPHIQDQLGEILRRYAEEIGLLKAVRHAGVIGFYKRRENAIQAFARSIDEESREIYVIGSSLKGLLQKEEYGDVATKLKFKMEQGLIKVKFLLTHPIVADFRASQENRRPTEIGLEIIKSLEILKSWDVDCSNVRLYLGTPTCFAIKTTRHMLINPYPYIAVSFDSPCMVLEYSPDSGSDRPGYFFDEFNSRHFGAWDTDLAVHIQSFDEAIDFCRKKLSEYADGVENILSQGKSFR